MQKRQRRRRVERRLHTVLRHIGSGSWYPPIGLKRAVFGGLGGRDEEATKPGASNLSPTYDYIVVGAGSAGCALAARLSEDPAVSVLLLEAGGSDEVAEVRTPAGYAVLQRTAVDWAYKANPADAAAMNGRVVNWPRGKMLGGCSSINFMAYVRGHRGNYDEWERALGCEGWGYEDVLPYFKRSEDCRCSSSSSSSSSTGVDDRYRGRGGPLIVNKAMPRENGGVLHPLTERWIEGCAAGGLPRNPDYNGASQVGVAVTQATFADGERQSSSHAFLRGGAAQARENITVRTCAHVTRIVTQGGRAIGVEFAVLNRGKGPSDNPRADEERLRDLPRHTVAARREVILAAGAVASPQLLLLSGIGPREHLGRLGIPLVVDSPGVGRNLQRWPWRPPALTAQPGLTKLSHILQYQLGLGGPASESMLQGTAFWHSSRVAAVRGGECSPLEEETPTDLQMHFVPSLGAEKNLLDVPLSVADGSQYDGSRLPTYGVTFVPIMLQPISTPGFIALRSSDPFAPPEIEPNALANPHDAEVLVEGLKKSREVAASSAFAGVLAEEMFDATIPHPPESDAYLREYVRRGATTVYHPVGTCRMGPDAPPGCGGPGRRRAAVAGVAGTPAVCDARLRVYGVAGLRVADASVMPRIISGNTNAPAIMIGERAADFIKEDWR